LPGDTAVVSLGHNVVFDELPDPDDECARLEIEPGAFLTFAAGATEIHVGGNGWHVSGGVDVRGTLVIPAGTTLTIDPDGNDVFLEDGLTVRDGGRLVVRGTVLQDGTVQQVMEDDPGTEIVFAATDPTPPGLDLANARLVWRTGLRKGRWY
jgi:hypothetical protein